MPSDNDHLIRRSRRRLLLSVLAVGLGCGAQTAYADWPMPRNNVRRTAVADGVSNITQPEPYWRFFAGGTIASQGALAWDVDSDGEQDVVLCTRNQLSAKRPSNNDLLWENSDIGCLQLVGTSDLDGDGEVELVIRSNNRVAVLKLSDGSVLWAEPAGEMGTVGTVRVADLNGDGLPEIVIQECGCCAVNSNNTGFVYSFAGNGATLTNPKQLWSLPFVFCGSYGSTAAIQARPGGRLDLTMADDEHIYLLDGTSGAIVAASPSVGQQAHASVCFPVNVDEDPREELLCVLSKSTPNIDARRLFLLRYVDGPAPQLQIDWQVLVGELDGGVRIPSSALSDLDGNGSLELVLTGRTAKNDPITFVYDARLGTLLAQVDGEIAAGTAPLSSGLTPRVLLTSDDGNLRGHQLFSGALAPLWTLPNRSVLTQENLQRGLRMHVRREVLTFDDDGDGQRELVVVPGLSSDRVQLIQTLQNAPVLLADYQPPVPNTILAAWEFNDTAGPKLAVGQSDGNFHFLDKQHQPISGNPEVGARFAGFYGAAQWRELANTPTIASLEDGGPTGFLVPTSRGAVVRLNTKNASFAAGPEVMWTRTGARNPIVVAGLIGDAPGIVTVERRIGNLDALVTLTPGGKVLWERPLAGAVLSDITWGNFDGDSTPDFFVQWGISDNIERELAISGSSGQPLWETSFGPLNRQPSGAALADWNNDGIDDVLMQANFTFALDGKNGSQLLASPSYDFAYSMPTIADVDGDGVDEVSLHARFSPARTLSHDLQTKVWESSEDDRPFTYAAMLRCPSDVPRFVGGSWAFPARLAFTRTSGPQAGQRDVLVLAGGEIFDSEAAAEAAGKKLGQVASPMVHLNLAGDGQPMVLVGSTDGWLYGLDGCTRALRFSYDFGAAVGAVVPGDTDGDGLDELVVAVADGFVYGLKQQADASVDEVLDTDPPNGIVTEDVDEIETDETLYAAWSGNSAAAGYEVAVVRDEVDGGGFISGDAEPWLDVGLVTSTTLTELPLENGRRYFVAVRAYSQSGAKSPDVLSDGVVARRKGVPATTGSGGDDLPPYPYLTGRSCVYACAVRPPDRDDLGWLLLPLAGLGFVLRRRSS